MAPPTGDRLPEPGRRHEPAETGGDGPADRYATAAGRVISLELDFEHRRRRRLDPDAARDAIERGGFVWIDLEIADPEQARCLLGRLAALDADDLDELLDGSAATSLTRRADHLLLVLPTSGAGEDPRDPGRLAMAVGERFLVTAHRGAGGLVADARRRAEDDFARHARTPGFLLYEMAGRVIDDHRAALRRTEARLDALQDELRGPASPGALAAVADIDACLVRLRRTLLDLRDTLNELATRRSSVVSESTQPYLAGHAATVDRLADDALAAREIASSAMTLYVASASSRAGRALGRLTGITVIFLPMLFTVQLIRADLDWGSPWSALWLLAVGFAASVIIYMRRHRLL